MITFYKWLKTESVGSDERVSLANNLLDKVEKGAIQEEIDAAYSTLAKYLRDNGMMSYSGMVIDAWGKGIRKTKEIMKILNAFSLLAKNDSCNLEDKLKILNQDATGDSINKILSFIKNINNRGICHFEDRLDKSIFTNQSA